MESPLVIIRLDVGLFQVLWNPPQVVLFLNLKKSNMYIYMLLFKLRNANYFLEKCKLHSRWVSSWEEFWDIFPFQYCVSSSVPNINPVNLIKLRELDSSISGTKSKMMYLKKACDVVKIGVWVLLVTDGLPAWRAP